jgi:hypothetical protein
MPLRVSAPKTGVPSQVEFNHLRGFFHRYGFSAVEVDGILGTTVADRTRQQIGETVRTWLAARPAGNG